MIANSLTSAYDREATPPRLPEIRIEDFLGTYRVPDILKLFKEQALRCCQCATPTCSQGAIAALQGQPAPGCPLNTLVPQWLSKVASEHVVKVLENIPLTPEESANLTEERLTEVIGLLLQDPTARKYLRQAFDLAMKRNVLSEILGAVCPQAEELCEGGTSREGAKASCVAGAAGFGPITIGNIENLIGRIGRQAGWLAEMMETPFLDKGNGERKRVAIVGGGPGGMASAMMLRRLGYHVSLYFREKHIGGLLSYGLPGTKLDKNVVREIEKIFAKNDGIELHPDTNVDAAEMTRIKAENDAVILAVGAQTPNQLGVKGEHQSPGSLTYGVATWKEFLQASITYNNFDEDPIPDELNASGKEVVVIGAGDTAMDCVREAVRQGAKKVSILYRGPEEGMKAVEKEIMHAKLEKVKFEFWQVPEEIRVDFQGHATAVVCRQGPVDDAVLVQHSAQLIINALGSSVEANLERKLGIPALRQNPEIGGKKTDGIKVDRWGNVAIGVVDADDEHDPKIHAVGDMVAGTPRLAVWAHVNATHAVNRIHQRLSPAADLSL